MLVQQRAPAGLICASKSQVRKHTKVCALDFNERTELNGRMVCPVSNANSAFSSARHTTIMRKLEAQMNASTNHRQHAVVSTAATTLVGYEDHTIPARLQPSTPKKLILSGYNQTGVLQFERYCVSIMLVIEEKAH